MSIDNPEITRFRGPSKEVLFHCEMWGITPDKEEQEVHMLVWHPVDLYEGINHWTERWDQHCEEAADKAIAKLVEEGWTYVECMVSTPATEKTLIKT